MRGVLGRKWLLAVLLATVLAFHVPFDIFNSGKFDSILALIGFVVAHFVRTTWIPVAIALIITFSTHRKRAEMGHKTSFIRECNGLLFTILVYDLARVIVTIIKAVIQGLNST